MYKKSDYEVSIINACGENQIPLLLTSTSEVYGVSEDKVWNEETRSLIGPPTKLRWSYAASKLIDEFHYRFYLFANLLRRKTDNSDH